VAILTKDIGIRRYDAIFWICRRDLMADATCGVGVDPILSSNVQENPELKRSSKIRNWPPRGSTNLPDDSRICFQKLGR